MSLSQNSGCHAPHLFKSIIGLVIKVFIHVGPIHHLSILLYTDVILVVICYLIWPCDIDVHITFLISHSYSYSYNTVIKGYFSLGV